VRERDALRSRAEKAEVRLAHICKQFSPMGLDANNNHSWLWRGSPERLKGPNMIAAIDCAMAKEGER